MKQLLYIALLTLAGCSMSDPDRLTLFTNYEYQIGENNYLAFSKRHYYAAWYNTDRRGEGVTPNVRCMGKYEFDGANLWLYPQEGPTVTYRIYERADNEFAMLCGADCLQVWKRTKQNNYIH